MSTLPDTSPLWSRYDAAAEWCAQRGITAACPAALAPLPPPVVEEITEHPEAFAERIREFAYARTMSGRDASDH